MDLQSNSVCQDIFSGIFTVKVKVELRPACSINSHKMGMKGEESVTKQL